MVNNDLMVIMITVGGVVDDWSEREKERQQNWKFCCSWFCRFSLSSQFLPLLSILSFFLSLDSFTPLLLLFCCESMNEPKNDSFLWSRRESEVQPLPILSSSHHPSDAGESSLWTKSQQQPISHILLLLPSSRQISAIIIISSGPLFLLSPLESSSHLIIILSRVECPAWRQKLRSSNKKHLQWFFRKINSRRPLLDLYWESDQGVLRRLFTFPLHHTRRWVGSIKEIEWKAEDREMSCIW